MSKKQLIEKLNSKTIPQNNVENCVFTGVKWDKEALESVNNVSKALLNLTELYKSQNINIECLLKAEIKKI